MRDKTILPTNLLDWPRVAPRLPEEKLILLGCWIGGGWMRSCGCGMLPLRPFAASLGFSPDSLLTGLRNLSAHGVELLALDETTGELFVMDWFRFHTFKSPVSISIAHRDIQKTVSEPLKNLILEKSKTCLPTATRTATATRTSSAEAAEEVASAALEKFASGAGAGGASQRRRKLKIHTTGVHTWTPEDLVDVDSMVETHGLDATTKAAAKLAAAGVKPLPSKVEEELNMQEIRRAGQGASLPTTNQHRVADPAAIAAGLADLMKFKSEIQQNQGAPS